MGEAFENLQRNHRESFQRHSKADLTQNVPLTLVASQNYRRRATIIVKPRLD